MEIIEKKALTYSEVKNLLKNSNKNVRTEKLSEFLNNFNIIEEEKALQLKKEIESLNIIRLKGKENLIIQIINLLPNSKEELIQILAGEKVTLPEESLEKILEIIKKYK